VLCAQENKISLKQSFKNKHLPAPIISYAPETHLVLGVFFMSNFKFNKKEELTRASNTMLSAYVSTRGQKVIYLRNTMYTNNEKWFLGGGYEYKVWPERYFGVGDKTLDSMYRKINYSIVTISQPILHKIREKHFLGPSFRFSNVWNVIVKHANKKDITEEYLPNKDGGDFLGSGITYIHDSRDNLITATKGHLISVSNHFFRKGFVSKSSFLHFLFDYRKFFHFKSDRTKVLAIQAKYTLTNGDVPFQELSRLGGENIMRGLLEGRYRDKCSWQVQTEYRMGIFSRLGMTYFIATGNVMSDPSTLNIFTTKIAGGLGLRYQLFKDNNSNVRLDFGLSEFGSGVYATFGEAF